MLIIFRIFFFVNGTYKALFYHLKTIFLIDLVFVAVCGKLPAKYIPHITGGVTPNITEFPWHASMYQEQPDKSKKYFCGATIIQESLLITAAHCVYDEVTKRVVNASKIYIATGNVFRDYDSPLHDQYLVKRNKVCIYMYTIYYN